MVEFFNALTGFEKALWLIAFPSSLIFLIQTVMVFFGLDGDGDTDFDPDTEIDQGQQDSGKSFGWFSFKNLVSFFAVFAWSGISGLDYGLSTALSLSIATLGGVAMVLIMSFLMLSMKNLAIDYSPKNASSIGKQGNVYLEIPPGGRGKIQILMSGALRTMDAVSIEKETIKRNQKIEVVGTAGPDLVVKCV